MQTMRKGRQLIAEDNLGCRPSYGNSPQCPDRSHEAVEPRLVVVAHSIYHILNKSADVLIVLSQFSVFCTESLPKVVARRTQLISRMSWPIMMIAKAHCPVKRIGCVGELPSDPFRNPLPSVFFESFENNPLRCIFARKKEATGCIGLISI